MRSSTSKVRRSGLVAIALAAILSVAACSGSDSSTKSSLDAEAPAAVDGGGDARDDSGVSVDNGALPEKGSPADVGVRTRAVISTGEATLVAEDLVGVRGEIDRLLGRWGGYVSRDQTTNDKHGKTVRATLQVRVPSEHFQELMDSLSEFATVKDASTQAEDVTTEVIDVESRLRTQELSLRRLRQFLRQTQDIDAMIRLEAEITNREAQLESLQGQQQYLADQTSLGTVSLHLRTPAEQKKEAGALDDAGFIPGLEGGWNALKATGIVVATVVGAVLPFAVLLALVALPLWLLLRRRHASSSQPPVPAPAPPTGK